MVDRSLPVGVDGYDIMHDGNSYQARKRTGGTRLDCRRDTEAEDEAHGTLDEVAWNLGRRDRRGADEER